MRSQTGRETTDLSATFTRFFDSEKAAGIFLLLSTMLAVVAANSPLGPVYSDFWHYQLLGHSLAHWVNDALMAVFFLLIGLELERELYIGELSDPRRALLPIVAAIGGMMVPAAMHFALNAGTSTESGFGIPMATDIAFALGVLAILGDRIPTALKVFVVAFAVIDDLGAILVIAIFYTSQLSVWYLGGALAVWAALVGLNRLRVMWLVPYLLGGGVMWFLLLQSGVHATLAGVMLAFAIPFSGRVDNASSPSNRLENFLHRPVAFVILPVFALANTGVALGSDWLVDLSSSNSMGIIVGLVAGKPLGVVLVCLAAVTVGMCRLPEKVRWHHMIGAGMLGGIGFTMSIFMANLAFAHKPQVIEASKIAILVASLISGTVGFLWLRGWARIAPS